MGIEVGGANPADAGQAVYTRGILRLYDPLVLNFSFPVLWRCPKAQLIGLYKDHVSSRHLDIGVATGRLLEECTFPSDTPEITLMDLNANSLAVAAQKLARYAPRVHRANVLDEWDLPPASFDSIGMLNLLHCVPGTIPEKSVAFEHAYTTLAPGGVLFGSTVLAEGTKQPWLSRPALWFWNRRGIFSNLKDSFEDLDAALGPVFDSHEIRVKGMVALFSARKQA